MEDFLHHPSGSRVLVSGRDRVIDRRLRIWFNHGTGVKSQQNTGDKGPGNRRRTFRWLELAVARGTGQEREGGDSDDGLALPEALTGNLLLE
jgi:hypothetical protein